MIYIDMSNFQPSADWLRKADSLTESLITATDDIERKEIIDKNSSAKHWRELKPNLPYAHKCWYTEIVNTGAPYHIEHFRPKKQVVKSSFEEAQRIGWTAINQIADGYWWLAFDWQNYRIAVNDMNSIYKKNYFPLQLNSFIAYTANDDYSLEQPFLLDPTVQGDPNLLTFEPDGSARETITDSTDIRHIRAKVSINIYGLNNIQNLKEARHHIWEFSCESINSANDKYEKMITYADENLAEYYNTFDKFENLIKKIKLAISPEKPFSAVAKACLDSYNYEWIEEYVL